MSIQKMVQMKDKRTGYQIKMDGIPRQSSRFQYLKKFMRVNSHFYIHHLHAQAVFNPTKKNWDAYYNAVNRRMTCRIVNRMTR